MTSPGDSKWQMVFDAIDDCVFLVAPNGVVTHLNQRAATLACVPRLHACGSRLDSFGTGALWKGLSAACESARDAVEPVSREAFESSVRRRWAIRATPLRSHATNDFDEVLIVARDVTELSELQRLAHERRTLSAMGALVAGVAHEVRNPLFAISASLDAFEIDRVIDDETIEFIGVLRTEVKRLSRLMGDLLDYGRPMVLGSSAVRLSEVLGAAVAECKGAAASAEVALTTEIGGTDPAMLGDRNRLVQVFVNLIHNAIQHSPKGAAVEVQLGDAFENDEACLECAVLDRGPGFKEEALERAFEPFYTRRRGGVGLGLALAQRIVIEHRGRVFAANRAGGGAVLMVRLPLVANRN